MISEPKEDLELLADAIERFATARAKFLAEHRTDYKSASCQYAYDREEDARREAINEINDALRDRPRDIVAALRQFCS